jgi:DNA-binding HxlR family transcriptional regulator
VLSLLATPINASVLESLVEQPRSLVDLSRDAGSPPPTTMRNHLRALARAGLVEKRRRNEFGGSVDYRLTASGQELSPVTEALSSWLTVAPEGPIALGSNGAKYAIKAFVEGWTTSIVRALATRPLCLTELDRVIPSASYPSLERRLSAMRQLGMIKALPGGRSTPYRLTDWLRGAIAPLIAAAHWEQDNQPAQAPPIINRDVETGFLLSLPLLRLPRDASGSCRLTVQVGSAPRTETAGAIAHIREGLVKYTEARVESRADAWAAGPSAAWLAAVIDRDFDRLELGGEIRLARQIVEHLHRELFGAMAHH